MLWSGDRAWHQSGERRMLCGLELPGLANQQTAFKGRWPTSTSPRWWPAGSCLGIDPTSDQRTDVAVASCAAPHAMEVTGTVNGLAEKFPVCTARRTGPGRLHQGFLHPADGRIPGAGPVALHHTDADLQHGVVAELVGRQPGGLLQHRRDSGQRRLGDVAEQRERRRC